jgi:hypothetical protein
MTFAFIAAKQAEHSIKLMCRVLEVSRSGYYAWAGREPCARVREDERLTACIRELFRLRRDVYGSPRMWSDLVLDDGERLGRKRVERLTRQSGLSALMQRKWKPTTIRVAGVRVADDLLDGDFATAVPDRCWVADIAYLRTWEGRLYLAAVQDLYGIEPPEGEGRRRLNASEDESPHGRRTQRALGGRQGFSMGCDAAHVALSSAEALGVGFSAAIDEALGLPREVAGAGQRAEEVRGVLVRQPPGRAFDVDRHLAHRVDRQPALCRLAGADRGDELDRLANVAQLTASARLVQHAFEVGGQCCGVRGQQDLAADGLAGHARGQVDRGAEEVA